MSWIKVEKQTVHKTEIIRIADSLRVSTREAFGACVLFWMWADGETEDGYLSGCTKQVIDRVVNLDGFADAILAVHWLEQDANGLLIPNFTRHNGESAKKRAMAAERQRRWRDKNG